MARRRRRDPLRPLSQAELEAQADLLLSQGLARPRQQIRRAQEEARRQAKEDAAMIQGFASAVAQIAGSSRLGQEQTAAGGRQQALTSGYAAAQQLAEQQAADQANALLAQQGGTQRIQAGPASQVTGYLGGLGANVLGVSGSALSDYARGVPGSIAGRGQQLQAQRLSQAQKEQDKFQDQLEDLMARVPGLRAEIMDRLYSRELQKSAAETQRQYLGVAQSRESFDQTLDIAKLEADIAQAGAKTKGEAGKQQAKAREARLKALSTNKEKAYKFADTLFKGSDDPNSWEVVRPTWREAYNKVWNRFGQGLMRYAPPGHRKWWRGQIDAMVSRALENAGFEMDFKKSRPG
jgi:hypothetical protein